MMKFKYHNQQWRLFSRVVLSSSLLFTLFFLSGCHAVGSHSEGSGPLQSVQSNLLKGAGLSDVSASNSADVEGHLQVSMGGSALPVGANSDNHIIVKSISLSNLPNGIDETRVSVANECHPREALPAMGCNYEVKLTSTHRNSINYTNGRMVFNTEGTTDPVDATTQTTSIDFEQVSPQVTLGYSYACGVNQSGQLDCWGINNYWQLGLGGKTQLSEIATPKSPSLGSVPTQSIFLQASESYLDSCAVAGDHHAYCWGYNEFGQLGNDLYNTRGNKDAAPAPVMVQDLPLVDQVIAGYDNTCAISTTGQGYCWGDNKHGQLGSGSKQSIKIHPVAIAEGNGSAIPADTTLKQIGIGQSYACALSQQGHVYCWGINQYGQLGNSSTIQYSKVPVAVMQGNKNGIPLDTTITQIAVGFTYACALDQNGQAYCWGADDNGQLGNGSYMPQSNLPIAVQRGGLSAISQNTELVQLAASKTAVCARSQQGHVYCWGLNQYGQLGNGTTLTTATPVKVKLPAGVKMLQISGGLYSFCGAANNGNTYCWGSDAHYELGDGKKTLEDKPVVAHSFKIFD